MTARRRLRIDLRQLAIAALVAWFGALVVAAVQLERWQDALGRTLLQLRADAVFRARLSSWDQVDPAWYRRKALALLGAMHKIEHDTAWTLAIPGSWAAFDNLEERLAARMQREFGDIVLETLRRELVLRASRLTGAPVARSEGRLRLPIDCAAPALPAAGRVEGGSPGDVPEAAALRDWLASLRDLDAAAQAWQRLQDAKATHASAQAADDLRTLVRYALDADLPGTASGRAALAALIPAGDAAGEALLQSLQAAVQCTLLKGVDALDQRLLARNELLATEQQLAERSAALFERPRHESVLQGLQHLQAVHALLQQEEALLAQGNNAWMRAGTPQSGAHAALFAQAQAVGLLGTKAVQQAQARSAAALAAFRQRFDALFGSGARSLLVWNEAQGRLQFSPDRLALRDGLALVLQEPMLRLDGDGALSEVQAGTFEDALAVAGMRKRLRRELLPSLPAFARPGIGRLLDARLALLAHDTALHAVRASLPQDLDGVFDPDAFRAQRAKVMQVQALLAGMGAPELAQRLASAQSAELGARLARAQEQLAALPLLARPAEFSWWQGEPAPLLRVLGVHDAAGLQVLLHDQYGQLDRLGRRAAQYIAAADDLLPADPATQRWQQLVQEIDRYRDRSSDSSMLALERYLLALGPYLKRETCVENLSAQSPPRHEDTVAQRWVQVHRALVARCLELRASGGVSGSAASVAP